MCCSSQSVTCCLVGVCDPYAAYVSHLSIVYFSHATSVFFLNTYLSDSDFIYCDSDSILHVVFQVALRCVSMGATRTYSSWWTPVEIDGDLNYFIKIFCCFNLLMTFETWKVIYNTDKSKWVTQKEVVIFLLNLMFILYYHLLTQIQKFFFTKIKGRHACERANSCYSWMYMHKASCS